MADIRRDEAAVTESPLGDPWLLYGAYGFTGRLIARHALDRGFRPVLAGRDGERTRTLSRELGLEARVFSLDDPGAVRSGLRGMGAVLNAAGPFSRTWRPMTRGCLDQGCAYLDITGEVDVLEGIQTLDGAVTTAGLHFVPAVGFDVVPTDCAAALAAETLPEAVALDLAFHSTGGPSPGTARTALERLGQPGLVRRGGRLEEVELGSVRRTLPFSDRTREGVAIPWGDVSTAWRSTGIPDIRVFAVLPERVLRTGRILGAVLKLPFVGGLARKAVDRLITGPDEEELDQGHARILAEVRTATGEIAVVELVTPNGYTLTASASVAAVERVVQGRVEVPPGVHTPSRAFGAEFVLGLPGVRRVM